ncbi:angio-associated migratory cell protein-like isoform X2 [Dysidea avara]|uniref:angio-associated migratory cell protein-like isoform X2 n=1 Tax=Dysidea avara TaxID=196820 RepID=UPI003322219B
MDSEDEGLEEDGFVLHQDDILQVIELGDEQPLNGVQDDLDDLDMDDDNSDHMNDDQGSADHDTANFDLPAVSNSTKDDSVGCFRSHTGSVFSVQLHPNGELAVSGGEDDKAFVWRTTDCSVVFECTGHKDSVSCTGFSYDGKYVATADMAGLVQVWKVTNGQCVWTYECADLEWIFWHTNSSILFAGASDGLGWMWKVPSNDCKCFQSPGVRNTCGVLLPDGQRACFGYENGRLSIWDLKSATISLEFMAHSSPLTCVAAHPDNNLVLTTSEDGTAQLVSINSKKDGVVKIRWCNSSPLLYTACLDGVVRLWDGRNGSVVTQWEGHNGQLLDMDMTSDDSTVVTASEDCTARVFSLHKPNKDC